MKKFEQYKAYLTWFLLAFVIFTIGFSLGKHSFKPQNNGSAADLTRVEPVGPAQKKFVKVYYLHASFRCATCNSIEKMARELLDRKFASELSTGKIVWEEADFQENEALAKKFEVVASCVVVALVAGENIIEFERLDQVWTKLEKPDEFNSYIEGSVRDKLQKAAED